MRKIISLVLLGVLVGGGEVASAQQPAEPDTLLFENDLLVAPLQWNPSNGDVELGRVRLYTEVDLPQSHIPGSFTMHGFNEADLVYPWDNASGINLFGYKPGDTWEGVVDVRYDEDGFENVRVGAYTTHAPDWALTVAKIPLGLVPGFVKNIFSGVGEPDSGYGHLTSHGRDANLVVGLAYDGNLPLIGTPVSIEPWFNPAISWEDNLDASFYWEVYLRSKQPIGETGMQGYVGLESSTGALELDRVVVGLEHSF